MPKAADGDWDKSELALRTARAAYQNMETGLVAIEDLRRDWAAKQESERVRQVVDAAVRDEKARQIERKRKLRAFWSKIWIPVVTSIIGGVVLVWVNRIVSRRDTQQIEEVRRQQAVNAQPGTEATFAAGAKYGVDEYVRQQQAAALANIPPLSNDATGKPKPRGK